MEFTLYSLGGKRQVKSIQMPTRDILYPRTTVQNVSSGLGRVLLMLSLLSYFWAYLLVLSSSSGLLSVVLQCITELTSLPLLMTVTVCLLGLVEGLAPTRAHRILLSLL